MRDLTAATTQLEDAWRQAERTWEEARAGWQDQTRVEFQMRFWTSIDAERWVYEPMLQELITVLEQARRNVN